jgi:trigger factor
MSTHSHDLDFKTIFRIEPRPGSLINITGEVPYAELEKERAAALRVLGERIRLPGFRPGRVPEAMLIKHVGETTLLSKMAELAIAHVYRRIVEAHALDPIGRPDISLAKLAPGNPLGLSITVTVVPAVSLPDYKALAGAINSKKEDVAVTEEEVDTAIANILRRQNDDEKLRKKAAASKAEAAAPAIAAPETAKEETGEKETPRPSLTDEIARSLGTSGQFANVDDFKTKLREHLTLEKTRVAVARHRESLTDAIIAGARLELPELLVESELAQMLAQMESDLALAGVKLDDYLSRLKKTRDDLKREWRQAAERRATLQLVLNEIAKKEKVKPTPEDVEATVAAFRKRHRNADERRIRLYVASVLTNEAVLRFLEAQ